MGKTIKVKSEDPAESKALNGESSKPEITNEKPDNSGTNGKVDEVDNLEVAEGGKDEVDAASIYSIYMEHDARFFFQHPYARLFIAYFVTFCNFLIYAEDPVAHSHKECNIPVIGNDFAFVGTRYPPNAWSLLKVVLWLLGTLVGAVVGKFLCHRLLFNRVLRLKMFRDNQGSWMIMFLTTIFCVFIFSYIYNAFLLIGGTSTEPYTISGLMSVRNSVFMKAAAVGTWCGDFFTAWMVTDIMLQEKLYPNWAKRARRWWQAGYHRIVLFWVVVVLSSAIVITVICTDWISWDTLNRDFLHTNEVGRAFLAAFILVCDLVIVMQDWDFPHFISNLDVKLPGLNTADFKFTIPRCLRRKEWVIHITGKWFNYGILFIVIILDLNMWKNQIMYVPVDFAQYTDPEGRIHTTNDMMSLLTTNATILSYSWRNSTINPDTNVTYLATDTIMNARYNDYPFVWKALAFIPSIGVFILFGVLIFLFGRFKPSERDRYAGRLKKRRKKGRFSMKFWKSRKTASNATETEVTGDRFRQIPENSSSAYM
ncbi:transmembrane protein 117-like [Liolophura sinensis]|uniref:transmembrane protein 117-like n=1 Tax=Liolophura sinensis TaxID=3198878 RepID=UPI00315938E6